MIYQLNCDWCHKEYKYKVQPSVFNRNAFHFCSLDCQNKWKSQRMKNKNPMKIKQIAEKQGKTLIKTYQITDLRKRLSESIKRSFDNGRINWNKGKYLSSLQEIEEYGKVVRSCEWQAKRMIILMRDNWRCQNCGEQGNNVDHIVPWRVSKDNSDKNLQCLCGRCNSKKVSEDKRRYS